MAAGSRLAALEASSPALRFRIADWERDIEWLKELEDRYENTGLITQQCVCCPSNEEPCAISLATARRPCPQSMTVASAGELAAGWIRLNGGACELLRFPFQRLAGPWRRTAHSSPTATTSTSSLRRPMAARAARTAYCAASPAPFGRSTSSASASTSPHTEAGGALASDSLDSGSATEWAWASSDSLAISVSLL